LDFRKRIVEDFAVVFNAESNEDDKRIVSESFAEKWSWFGVMYRLAGGQIVNLDKITRLNLLECLTWLSFETDLESQNKVQYGSKQ
tara:strand:+ start:125 stop:382 length:258 start_codon:yes stop_codon:yes gene_type:complete